MKRSLVLSGGGAFGAWQSGNLNWMDLNQYDAIYGISVGALNGAFISAGGTPEELREHWLSVNTKKVYKKWFAWPLSVPFKRSVYNSAPLEKWVDSILGNMKIGSALPFKCGYVDLETGKYVVRDNPTVEDVLASASYPGFLKPVPVDGRLSFDGGVRHVSPIGAAIDDGATSITCLLASRPGVGREKPGKSIATLKRAIWIMSDQIMVNDLKTCLHINQAVSRGDKYKHYRHVRLNAYMPDAPLVGSALDFSPENVRANMKIGMELVKL